MYINSRFQHICRNVSTAVALKLSRFKIIFFALFFKFSSFVRLMFLICSYFFWDSSREYPTNNFQYYPMSFQYWCSWLFELELSNKNFELCLWIQTIHLLGPLRTVFFSRCKWFFRIFSNKKNAQPDVHNFHRMYL